MFEEFTQRPIGLFKYAERQEEQVTTEQRSVLDGIIERLESRGDLIVKQITPVWYIVEMLDKRVQLEVDNPGGNLDITEIPADDGELVFPRRSWGVETVKLNVGNEEFAVKKIIAKFAILRDED